jgi:hypothetical protein
MKMKGFQLSSLFLITFGVLALTQVADANSFTEWWSGWIEGLQKDPAEPSPCV